MARSVVEVTEQHLATGRAPERRNQVVAVALRAALHAVGQAGLRPLAHETLWLLRTPPGCEQCVWDVVALAALGVIDSQPVDAPGCLPPAGEPSTVWGTLPDVQCTVV